MRWSSSTTRMCAALSGSDSIRLPPIGTDRSAACLHRLRQQRLHPAALLRADHREEKTAQGGFVAASAGGERAGDPLGLQLVETAGQNGALGGCAQATLAPVGDARLLLDPPGVDHLLQHRGKALLGDLEDFQKVRDPEPRMTLDEVQNAMVGAAETKLGEDGIGIAREIAVGEKKQLDDREQTSVGRWRRRSALAWLRRRDETAQRVGVYVSHVDLSDPDC